MSDTVQIKITPILFLIGVIFLIGCPTPQLIEYKISQNKHLKQLQEEGLAFYTGNNPPIITGCYKQIKMKLTQYLPEKSPAPTSQNIQLEFEAIPNKSDAIFTRIIFLKDPSSGYAPLTWYELTMQYCGEGDFFSLYCEHKSRDKKTNRRILSQFVISGKKEYDGIKDLTFAIYERYYHVIYGELYNESLFFYDNRQQLMPSTSKLHLQ